MLHSGMVLAAPQSGSGKTTITCALLAAMKNRKLAVRAFKSGPDYIDCGKGSMMCPDGQIVFL